MAKQVAGLHLKISEYLSGHWHICNKQASKLELQALQFKFIHVLSTYTEIPATPAIFNNASCSTEVDIVRIKSIIEPQSKLGVQISLSH